MPSIILRLTSLLMLPVLLLFSVFMLLRGHNLPGGGFIGGLVAAAAILLQMVAFGPSRVRQIFPISFRHLMVLGGLVAVAAGLPGLLGSGSFLTGIWLTLPGPDGVKLGTPLLFDFGVYTVVLSMTVEVILTVAEEEEWKGSLPS